MRSKEIGIYRGLVAKKDDELVLKHTMIIQMLGSTLNIAQLYSVRENAMTNFKFKKQADTLQKIADQIMSAKLGVQDFQLKSDMKDMMQYDYSVDLYRIVAHFVGKSPEYLKMAADEFESKEKLYKKLIRDAEQI